MTLDIHHLGLSVTSLEEGKEFFVDLLGWKVVREDVDYPSLFVSNDHVIVTLWKVSNDAIPFNPKTNVGLHHFAIDIESTEILSELYRSLAGSTFKIEMPISTLRGGPTKHFFVHGPSDVRIEFICAPQ